MWILPNERGLVPSGYWKVSTKWIHPIERLVPSEVDRYLKVTTKWILPTEKWLVPSGYWKVSTSGSLPLRKGYYQVEPAHREKVSNNW